MRGWMAQITATSPTSLKATSVDEPGACEPRLNSLPLLADMMLCGTVSSLRKVSASPRLTVMLSEEKARPCWWMTSFAASAPVERPPTMARMSRLVERMMSLFFRLARQDRSRGRDKVAGERVEEGDELGLLLGVKAKRLHQVGAAPPGATRAPHR